MGVPCRSAIHVECPPRLLPATSQCAICRSSEGKRYEGRKSMRYETSRAVPAACHMSDRSSMVLVKAYSV